MSSLLRYLAPTHAARPNPGHVVEWRHGEGGPWSPLDPSATQGVSKRQVADLLTSPAVPMVQGDLVRVRAPKGRVVGFSVMTGEGLVALPSGGDRALLPAMYDPEMRVWHRASGYDWENAWEGCARADWMLGLAAQARVDPKLLMLAACDCAETALPYVPAGEDRPRLALEAARRWARGEGTHWMVEDAAQTAMLSIGANESDGIGGPVYQAALDAIRSAAWAALADEPFVDDARARYAARYAAGAGARYAAGHAASAAAWHAEVAGGNQGVAAWQAVCAAVSASLANLVRRRIPLRQLALALAARASHASASP